MKTSPIAATAVLVLFAATSVWAARADRTRPTHVPLSSTQHGEVVIPVFIEGQGPYRFILDTGSSHSAISETLATALGAAPVAKAPVATAVGSILSAVVRLQEVEVGSAQVESLLATALPRDAADWLGDGINGVLGQDFLSQFDYTLDYRSLRLSWNDSGQTEKGVRLALEPSHGRFLVHLPQDDRCHCAMRLVPDSGASGVVLFTGTEADQLPIDTIGAPMRVSSLAGTRTARRVTVRKLIVGSATLLDVPAVTVVLPEGTTQDGAGLLPLSLFARVSFNHHDGYMTVQPR
ncbi:MAG TPA: retroviral-like aspartic protease family protein [Vicinamibacterales bacterium]|nr:retroviral-like aspartic protease family protein [Vicinamibacterales bacterium]